jgi:hypothetical protein
MMVLTLFNLNSWLAFGAAQFAITLFPPPEEEPEGFPVWAFSLLKTERVDSAANKMITFFMF